MKRYYFKRTAGLLFAMVLMVTLLPIPAGATEPEANTEQEEQQTYIKEPYLQVNLATFFSEEGLILTPEKSEVKILADEDGDGIYISGTVAQLNACRITIKDQFNFNHNPVGRVCVDGLAESGVTAKSQVYLDDQTTPAASISLVNATDDNWNNDGNRTIDVYSQKISGVHQATFGFEITGKEESETVTIFLRNLEFAENSIPVLYFDLDESQGTIDEMNSSSDHSKNCYGSLDIQVPNDYKSEYMDSAAKDLNDLKLEYIRGRGNSTWTADKKPYKVKFDKKQDLFGMGENKHWVLIANRYDNTLLHNRITYWLTAHMGMEFTPQCVPVEVVMNGRYYGNYLLCEQMRIGESRIDIDEMEAGDTQEPEVTGGYFLSLSPYEKDPDAGKFTTQRGVKFYINDPGYEEDDDVGQPEQKAYISQYVQDTEDAIFGEDFKDENGKGYQEYLDLASAIDYWWVQEFSTNHDAYKSPSTYLYKQRSGKLYWGPLWDFDSEAWGNMRYDPAQYEEKGFYSTSTDSKWMAQMMLDPVFTDGLVARWDTINDLLDEIVEKGGILDQYYEETKISQRYDNELWGYYTVSEEGNINPDGTYSGEVEQFRSWIRARQAWVDDNIDQLSNIARTVTFVVDGQESPFAEKKVLAGFPLAEIPDAPEKDGFVWLDWQTEDGASIDDLDWSELEEDITFYAYYIPEEEAVMAEDIFFQLPEVWIDDTNTQYITPFTTVPENNQEKYATWTSSDETIATVDKNGVVYLHADGTVRITAALKNGKSKSYQLYICDAETTERVKLDSISFAQDTVDMQVGDYQQNEMRFLPGGLLANEALLDFTSDNEDVVTVDGNGVLHAVGEGTAVITVYEYMYEKTATFVVNVSAKSEEPQEITYTFSKGGNGTWTKGSTGTFDLTVNREKDDDQTFSHFTGITVDRALLDTKHYEATSGSLNAAIKADYLNTLSAGTHTLTVQFDDGAAETKLTVAEAAAADDSQKGGSGDQSKSVVTKKTNKDQTVTKRGGLPITGDDMHAVIWLIILAAAVCGLAGFSVNQKRSKKAER